MAITVSGTTITFNDGSTQSTAVSGSGVPSTLTGVGATNLFAMTSSTAVTVGNTLSGSYLFYIGITVGSVGDVPNPSGNRVNATSTFTTTFGGATNTATCVGTGTWMCVGFATARGVTHDTCSNTTAMNVSLWRRIS